MSQHAELPPSTPAGPDPDVPPHESPKKLSLWGRVVQRYRWMSPWNKVALWAFVALVIVTAASFQYVVPTYRYFKSQMYLNMADRYIEDEDYNAASLAFRKAILSNHRSPEVWKRLGAFLEKIQSPEVAKIHETLVDLEPEVHEHKIRQAEAMLRQGRGFQTQQILEALPPEAKETVDFHRVSAEFALTRRDYEGAGNHYDAWLALDPGNEDVAFRKLVTRMYSPDPLIAYPAKYEIEAIASAGGDLAAQAYRELVARSVQEGDVYDASRLASRLVELPDPKFEDMATYLNLEIASQSFALPLALEKFLAYGKNDPARFPQVAGFMLERGQLQAVRSWMETLPDDLINHPDVQITRLQIALASQDWPSAFAILRGEAMPFKVPENTLRLAEEAFAQHDAHNKDAEQTWQRAIFSSPGNAGALQVLSLLAEARGWKYATGRTLQALASLASGNIEAWRRLARFEALTGNLAGYHHALGGLMRINPYDIGVGSDWVLSSVLLRKESPEAVLKVAERAYKSTYPANPAVATSYAVALLGSDRNEEAFEVINAMSASDRAAPERAIYIGAVYAANGHTEQALDYLNRDQTVAAMRFAEERGFRRVWSGIARGEITAQEELQAILAQRTGWQDDADKIAAELQREMEIRYDPATSQRILEDLRAQADERRRTPAELQKLVQELRGPSPTPAGN